MNFKIILQEAEEGGYIVSCPALPGCHSQGDSQEEALENIKEAIAGCLQSLAEETTMQPGALKERINSFERKHGCSLKAFEDRIARLPEDFERWDDLIEWKAYVDSLRDLESGLKRSMMQKT